MRCAVFGCNVDDQSKHFQKGEVSFFRFPSDGVMCKAWKNACSRKDNFNTTNARVCSKHFKESHYKRDLKCELLGYAPKNRRLLNPEAVPTENLRSKPCSSAARSSSNKRQDRFTKRSRTALVEELLNQQIEHGHGEGVNCGGGNDFVDEKHIVYSVNNNNNEIVMINNSCALTKDVGTSTEIDHRDQVIAELQQQVAELKSQQQAVHKVFTLKQIQKLQQPKVRPRWTVEDVSKAIVIYSAGPRAYRLLLKKGYPFPAVSTLRSWLRKIKIPCGILKSVFNIIKLNEMNEMNKVCILSFDEIKTRKIYLYDKANDQTMKPSSYTQVVMLRGLFSNWKMPIFYDFDRKLDKHCLFEIINYVENAGFHIVGMVSDLGGGNRSLHKELEISVDKTWFKNPSNEQKIYVFADVPHLIKLIRNHFVDSGFILDNNVEINKSVIEELLEITSASDLSIAHKISKESLNVKNAARQKVKLATKLFSHTVSSAISRCGMNGLLQSENWIECAEFFKLVNDWFDCLNVRVPQEDARDRKKAYGLALDVQNDILTKMTDVVKNMRVKGKKSLLPFQTGIIITNTSLPLLYQDLVERFGIKFILTYKLNQDVLEIFFSIIRAKGGLHDHPDPLEFRYRLRSYILGRNEGSLSAFGNVETDDTPDLLASSPEINLSAKCFTNLIEDENEDDPELDPELKELEDVLYDGLENLAGFICNRVHEPGCSLASSVEPSFSWVDHLNEGGLTKPSPEFMIQIQQLEVIFNEVNGDGIFITKNYLKKLLRKKVHMLTVVKSLKNYFLNLACILE